MLNDMKIENLEKMGKAVSASRNISIAGTNLSTQSQVINGFALFLHWDSHLISAIYFFTHNYHVFSEVTSNSKSLMKAWEFCSWESSVHATNILWGILALALSLASVHKSPLGPLTLISPSMLVLIMHNPSSAPNSYWTIGTWLFIPL